MIPSQGRQHGASAVEFALVLPILVLFLFGMIELSLAYFRGQGMEAAAREGARVASIGGDAADAVENALPSLIDFADVSPGIVITGSCPGDDEVTVRIAIANNLGDYAIRIPLVAQSSPDYEATATFRCERTF